MRHFQTSSKASKDQVSVDFQHFPALFEDQQQIKLVDNAFVKQVACPIFLSKFRVQFC